MSGLITHSTGARRDRSSPRRDMSRHLSRPGSRATRLATLVAPVVGLVAAGGLVWQSSYAAFTATTDNGTNSWASGSVILSDNDSETAMFTVTNAKPGQTGSRCIEVTSSGTLASTVELYGSGLATTKGLSTYLNLAVTQGTGTAANCSDFSAQGASVYNGTLAGFTATNFAGGYGDWAPTGTAPEKRAFKFDWTLASNAPDSSQTGTASVTFVWEAQNS
jgi:hypothetical protein